MKILISEHQHKLIINELSNLNFQIRLWSDFLIKKFIEKVEDEKLNNFTIDGKENDEAYQFFPVDYFVFNVSDDVPKGGGGYDEIKSGYINGEYYVYFIISKHYFIHYLNMIFNHELRHAFEDYKRISLGKTRLSKSKEGINYFSGDFSKLMTNKLGNYGVFSTVIRSLYYTSKIEESAYGETVYDGFDTIINDIKSILKYNFNINTLSERDKESLRNLWERFKKNVKIPIVQKFDDYESFLSWAEKKIKFRGKKVLNKLLKIKHYRDTNSIDNKKRVK